MSSVSMQHWNMNAGGQEVNFDIPLKKEKPKDMLHMFSAPSVSLPQR